MSSPSSDLRRFLGLYYAYAFLFDFILAYAFYTALFELEGMSLTREQGNTVLCGPVRDQAELQGLLRRVSDLGLTLLSATALDEASTS